MSNRLAKQKPVNQEHLTNSEIEFVKTVHSRLLDNKETKKLFDPDLIREAYDEMTKDLEVEEKIAKWIPFSDELRRLNFEAIDSNEPSW